MSRNKNIPAEIVRVRQDHGTLYVRLPRFWARAKGIEKGSYMVWRSGPPGALMLASFEDEIDVGKKITKR